MPDLDIPIITVMTVYPGAGPAEVLEEITKPLEKATRNIDNVKTVNSTSLDNVSVLVMEFDFGDDLDKAKREVDDAVKSVKLPDVAQAPSVGMISFDAMPMMRLAVAGKNGQLPATEKFVRNKLVPELQGIDGVADVQLAVKADNAVRIKLLPEKLKANNLTADRISQFLMATNMAVPAGELSFEGRVLPVTVGKKFDSLKALKDMPFIVTPPAAAGSSMSMGQGQTGQQAGAGAQSMSRQAAPQLKTVTLGEIAEVTRGTGKTSVASRLNFKPAIGVNIIKEPGQNTVKVADAINEKLDSLRAGGPSGLKIRTIEDQSEMVRDSISGLVREGLMGAVLAMLVILLFLSNWRSTLIAIVSIPLSILISIIALRQLGFSLNIMTLAGLAVAVGRIVDDSIVVIENIFRHRKRDDLAGDELVNFGTKEVSAAITSSTLTFVGAFVPLALVSGIIGQVFTPFAVAVVSAVLASLLVALTVVPLMAKYLIAGSEAKGGSEVMGLSLWYKRVLQWSLNHKLVVFGIAVVFFAASLGLTRYIGSNFLPTDEQKQLNISIEMPAGVGFKTLDAKTKEVEDILRSKSIKSRLATVGSASGQMQFFSAGGAANKANVFVELNDTVKVKKFAKNLRSKVEKIAGKAEISVTEIDSMGGMSQQMEVLVTGNDLNKIRTAAAKTEKIMAGVDGLANVKSNLEEVKKGVAIDVDPAKSAAVGLTGAQVGGWLRDLLVGKDVTRMTIDDEGVDVVMSVKTAEPNGVGEVSDLMVSSPLGMPVRLGDIAKVREHEVPVSITRRDEKQFASIKADVTTADSGRVSQDLLTKLDETKMPKGTSTKLSGVTEEMDNGFSQLAMAMLVAIAMVYLIMVVAFGEARAPLAILFSLPFAATGALIGLFVGNQQINISSMIGGLMLVGIVVTNAIVLIELVQQKRAAGVPVREALLDSGATRLRPILMTALTTIIALLPLGLGLSNGGVISQSLAVAVIGGLTTSTFLTLIIAPIVFEWLAGFGSKSSAGEVSSPKKRETDVSYK